MNIYRGFLIIGYRPKKKVFKESTNITDNSVMKTLGIQEKKNVAGAKGGKDVVRIKRRKTCNQG